MKNLIKSYWWCGDGNSSLRKKIILFFDFISCNLLIITFELIFIRTCDSHLFPNDQNSKIKKYSLMHELKTL